MEARLEISDTNIVPKNIVKSDKALEEFIKKKNIRREMDVNEIYLGNKDLKELRSLKRFKNLSRIWLNSNKFQTLPFILNCHTLSEIYLQNNLLQTIENCFRNLTNIEVLFLNANQLTDMNSVANELSYLKFLKNLNLFDNPMALERSYKNYVIHKCPNLIIFDRNTITESDRKRSFRIYEQERVEINAKQGFMTHINPDKPSFPLFERTVNIPKRKPKLINARLIHSSKNLKSRPQIMQNDTVNNDFSKDSSRGSLQRSSQSFNTSRSLKEFSYFDWSKVKLYKNDYRVHEASQNSIFHANDVSLIRTARTNRNNLNNFDILQHQSNELPQVVTIRFT